MIASSGRRRLVVGRGGGRFRPAGAGAGAAVAADDHCPAPRRRTLPRGSGSFAIIRTLAGLSGSEFEESGATALAGSGRGVSARASQVLRQLAELRLSREPDRQVDKERLAGSGAARIAVRVLFGQGADGMFQVRK